MEVSEIANVESKYATPLRRCIFQLLSIGLTAPTESYNVNNIVASFFKAIS